MDDNIKKMIADFDKKCADAGHAFAPYPLGGEYCKACGVTRDAETLEKVGTKK